MIGLVENPTNWWMQGWIDRLNELIDCCAGGFAAGALHPWRGGGQKSLLTLREISPDLA
jgi:hypothetical protein